MFTDNDILGRPRTTRYWIVYPKDYQPGDGYYTYRYKKDAVGKAKAWEMVQDYMKKQLN